MGAIVFRHGGKAEFLLIALVEFGGPGWMSAGSA